MRPLETFLTPFLYLLRCPSCRAAPAGVHGCCPQCLRSRPVPVVLPGLVALGHYRGGLARAVKAAKYRGYRRLLTTFAKGLAELVASQGWRPDVVTHVPLHHRRRQSRGYDQAEILATELARRLDAGHRRLLERIVLTERQASLGLRRRQTNVAAAFRLVVRERLEGSVLLVDDVFTTGATSDSCRRLLRSAGADPVHLAAVAVASRRSWRTADPPPD